MTRARGAFVRLLTRGGMEREQFLKRNGLEVWLWMLSLVTLVAAVKTQQHQTSSAETCEKVGSCGSTFSGSC